ITKGNRKGMIRNEGGIVRRKVVFPNSSSCFARYVGLDLGTATLTIHDPTTAANDTYSGSHGQTLTVAVDGVVDNDTTSGGTPAVSAVNGSSGAVGNDIALPSDAHLTLNADGSFAYVPVAAKAYDDSFQVCFTPIGGLRRGCSGGGEHGNLPGVTPA